jgi:hypothetical protein
MPVPIGGIGVLAIGILISFVAPGAWWLIGVGAAGGVVIGGVMVLAGRKRALTQGGRRNILLPLVLAAAAVDAAAQTRPLRPAVPLDPVDGIVEAFKTHQVVMNIRPFVIQSDSGKSAVELQPDIASWPVMSLTLVRGTVLGDADFTVFNGDNDRYAIRGVDDFVKIPKQQHKPMRMEELADAILWNGVTAPPAPILLSKDTCADPVYLPMRLARIALAGLPRGEADAATRACGAHVPK